MSRLVTVVAALLAFTTPSAARKPRTIPCLDARFVVDGIVGVAAGTGQLLVLGSGQVSLAGGCDVTAVVARLGKRNVKLHATWREGSCHDLRGRTKLTATVALDCSTVTGNVVAKKARFRHPVTGKASTCGDHFVDAGRNETCESASDCPSAGDVCDRCACAPGTPVVTGSTTTTTTTLPPITTRCCQAVGACVDADEVDAAALCSALNATLAPAGAVCDAANTAGNAAGPQCGAVASHGTRCCQCPEQSPPFPHAQLCFESNTASCGTICTRLDGATCDPVSLTCKP